MNGVDTLEQLAEDKVDFDVDAMLEIAIKKCPLGRDGQPGEKRQKYLRALRTCKLPNIDSVYIMHALVDNC